MTALRISALEGMFFCRHAAAACSHAVCAVRSPGLARLEGRAAAAPLAARLAPAWPRPRPLPPRCPRPSRASGELKCCLNCRAASGSSKCRPPSLLPPALPPAEPPRSEAAAAAGAAAAAPMLPPLGLPSLPAAGVPSRAAAGGSPPFTPPLCCFPGRPGPTPVAAGGSGGLPPRAAGCSCCRVWAGWGCGAAASPPLPLSKALPSSPLLPSSPVQASLLPALLLSSRFTSSGGLPSCCRGAAAGNASSAAGRSSASGSSSFGGAGCCCRRCCG